jgi:polycystin 1L2
MIYFSRIAMPFETIFLLKI